MKKLKIILPILLISLFFNVNVKALSTSTYYTNLKYSESTYDDINSYSSKIDLILSKLSTQDQWCHNSTCFKISDGNVVPIIKMDTLSTNAVRVYIAKITNTNNHYITTIYNTNGSDSRYVDLRFGYLLFDFNFSNDAISSTTYQGTGSQSFKYWFPSDVNPTTADSTLYISDYYYYYNFLNENNNINFKVFDSSLNNTFYSLPLDILGTYYTAPTTIPLRSLLYSFVPETNPNVCTISEQIGQTSNIQSITFRISGFTNALDFPLEGYVDLVSQDDLQLSNSYDWSSFVGVQVTEGPSFDEDVTVSYDVSYDYSTQTLHFEYSATTEDDTDSYVDVLFTLTYNDVLFKPFFKSNLFIYACRPYHGTISYAYRDDLTGTTISSDSTLMNFLNNGSDANTEGLINFVKNHDAGPVDSILTLPLNILQALLNKFSSNTCSPVSLPLPFANMNISLPCVNTLYNQINGLDTFLTWFSGIFSAFLLYKYFMFLYRWVDDMLTLRETHHFGGY